MRYYELPKTTHTQNEPLEILPPFGPARAEQLYRSALALRAALASSKCVAVVDSYKGGNLLVCPANPRQQADRSNKPRGKRAACDGFSDRSAQAFRCLLGKLDAGELPLFVTLTYPEQWPSNPTIWKRHLDTFTQRLVRSSKDASGVWKLEPQQRGAPHFHLIIYGMPYLDFRVVALWWYSIVGSEDVRHLDAGTRVERARSTRGVMAYASKKYLCKLVTCPDSWQGVGRFWGAFNRKSLPVAFRVRIPMGEEGAVRFRRIMRKQIEKQGRRMGGGKMRLFTSRQACWRRLAVLAALGGLSRQAQEVQSARIGPLAHRTANDGWRLP